jgi:hypothetical protein
MDSLGWALMVAVIAFAGMPLPSQTPPVQKQNGLGFFPRSGQAARGAADGKFKPAVFQGLVVGRTKLTGVIKRFGQPDGTWRNGDGYTSVYYHDIAPIPGMVEMYENERTHIIGTVIVSPKDMSLEDVQKALGLMLKPVHYAFDDCLGNGEASPVYESPTGNLVFFEANESGISVHANDNNVEIVYQSVPTGSKTSRCAARQNGIRKKPAQ